SMKPSSPSPAASSASGRSRTHCDSSPKCGPDQRQSAQFSEVVEPGPDSDASQTRWRTAHTARPEQRHSWARLPMDSPRREFDCGLVEVAFRPAGQEDPTPCRGSRGGPYCDTARSGPECLVCLSTIVALVAGTAVQTALPQAISSPPSTASTWPVISAA